MEEYTARIASPIGPLTLVASDRGVRSISMERAGATWDEVSGIIDHPLLAQAAEQLAEYFGGTRTAFDSHSIRQAPRSSSRSGPRCGKSPMARPAATWRSPANSAARPRPVRSAPPTAAIRSPSSRRATA